MALFQELSIISRLVGLITCSALALLIFSQLWNDARGRLFGVLMLNITAVAFFGLLSRLASAMHSGDEMVYWMFLIGTLFTATLPSVIFMFAVELQGAWTRWRRATAALLILDGLVAVVLFLVGHGFERFSMSDDGFLDFVLTPTVNVLLIIGVGGVLLSLQSAWQHYRQVRDRATLRLLIGFGILCFGFLTIAIKDVNRYSPQMVIYAAGALVLSGVILRQRLFDPLSQLNIKLSRQAEQFRALASVGQQATAFLELDMLLNGIVREIRQSFGCCAVTVYLPDETGKSLIIKAAAGANAEAVMRAGVRCAISDDTAVCAAVLSRKRVDVEDVRHDPRAVGLSFYPDTRAEVSLPLLVGGTEAEEKLIGVLHIQSTERGAFVNEDREVFQILASQIATAILHAQLFEEAQQARLAADEANRRKTKYLSEMSHELRTPLQVVIACSQGMLKEARTQSAVQLPVSFVSDLQRIEKSGKHLHRLINNILDLSKIEAGATDVIHAPFDPLPILREVAQSSMTMLHAGVELRTAYPEALPYLFGFDMHFREILTNLSNNACKFTQKGQIVLDAQVVDRFLRVSVSDTGPGIAPDDQAGLFIPYGQVSRTLARKHGGTGLGLAVCKQHVTLNGGQIGCDSTPGKGSTFFFTFPLASAEDQAAATVEEPDTRVMWFDRAISSLPTQILVIDEQLNTRERLQTALVEANYAVAAADNADSGVLLANLLTPGAVIVNLHSSGDDSLAPCVEKLRSQDRLKNVPVIISQIEDSKTPGGLNEILQQMPPIHVTAVTSRQERGPVVVFEARERQLPPQVLLVDTNERTRDAIAETLSRAGYGVAAACTVSLGMALADLIVPRLVLVVAHPDTEMEMAALIQILHTEANLTGVPILEIRIEDETLPMQPALMEQIRQVSFAIEEAQK